MSIAIGAKNIIAARAGHRRRWRAGNHFRWCRPAPQHLSRDLGGGNCGEPTAYIPMIETAEIVAER